MNPKPPPRVPKKAPPPKKDVPVPPKPEPVAEPSGELPFLPVMQMPGSPDAVLNNLLAREVVHPSGPEEPDSENVALMRNLVTGMAKGDISVVKERLAQKAKNQVEKSQVIEAILNDDNFERTALWLFIRHNTEKVMKRASARGDLTSGEAIVMWEKAQQALKECFSRLEKTKPMDSVTVVEKIDIKAQEIEHVVAERWKGTSPQGREIIRKKLHALKKSIQDVKATPFGLPKPK